jgi:hypothetical protein
LSQSLLISPPLYGGGDGDGEKGGKSELKDINKHVR